MAFHPITTHVAARRTLAFLGAALLLTGLLPLDQLSAQTGEMMPGSPAMPFTEGYQGTIGTRDMAMRINYDTKRYGQDNGQFGIGVQGHRPRDNGLWLFSAQYNLDFGDIDRMGLNVGGGIRALHQDWLGMGRTRVAGATLWYDGAKTDLDNYFNEFGFSLESLGDQWDFRLNGNFPIGDLVQDGDPIRTGQVGYSGTFLTEITTVPTDVAVSVVDFEVARRISDYDAWVLAGGYGLDADGDTAFGGKVGARGWLGSDALLELSLTHDDMFKTRVNFAVVWYPGRSPLFGHRGRCIDDRLRDPVMRNDYIALRREHRRGDAPLTDISGNNIRVVHAFSEATAPGDGSYENPFASIDDVFAGSKKGDIVLLWSGSEFDGESIVLRDLQRLLGEGGGVSHMVSTLQLGEVRLPETRPGAWTGPVPEINNTAGAAVTLGAASTFIDVNAVGFNPNSRLSYNEVSNLAIDGGNVAGSRGIVSSAVGIGEASINRVTVANTAGNGIELNPILLTYDNNGAETKVAAFNPTIKNSSFSGVGGDDIHLEWNLVEPASTNVSENIQISNVTSTGAGGWGINIIENQRSATITNYTFNAGAASDGGIRFDKGAGANVSNATIVGGAGTSGIGVSIDNESNGVFTFTNTQINNMAAVGFHVDGGNANVTFTGLITQNSALATAVLVENNHTGSLTFNERVTNQGVVLATAGAGLVFNDAKGVYTFNHLVDLEDVSTGIAITNADADAGGLYTFSKVAIDNATNAGLMIDGGQSAVTITGLISQTAPTAGLAVDIKGGHNGTLTFNEKTTGEGVIVATAGAGMAFDNADGTYDFNHAIRLSGEMTAGISITGGSDGRFDFDNVAITNIEGVAFNLNGGTADVNFTGLITQEANDHAVVTIADHEAGVGVDEGTGTVVFREKTPGQGIIAASMGDGLDFSNADGTYNFVNKINLDGSVGSGTAAGIDIHTGSDGTFTFGNVAITNIAGVGFNLNGGSADVTFTGKITQTTGTQAAVNVQGGHTGSVVFNEATAGAGVITASSGAGLTFNQADGLYTFNHLVDLDNLAVGINITDSDGEFTFSNALIDDATVAAVRINGGEANVNFTGLITQNAMNAGYATYILGGHTGTVTFNEVTSGAGVIVASRGPGLLFNQADGLYVYNHKITLSGGAVVDVVNSEGTINFNSTSSKISNTSDTAFTVDSGSATVSYNGTIATTGGRPVELTNNTGGTVTFGGKIESTAEGILVQNNTGGTFRFNGLVDLDTTTNDAISLSGNATASEVVFTNLDVTTTTGNGLVADGGTLTVTGTTNKLAATGGTALSLTGVTIGASGARFQSVSADGGTNGIVLSGLTGGALSVGLGGNSPGDGGTIQNTTGDGILITNCANVSLNNMLVTGAGGDGVNLSHTGAGAFNVTIAGSNFNNNASEGIALSANGTGNMRLTLNDNVLTQNGAESIEVTVGASAGNTYVTLNNNDINNTSGDQAFLMTVNGGTAYLKATNGNFVSNSTDPAFDVVVNPNAKLNATVTDNSFGSSAGLGLRVWNTGDGATVRLSMLDNQATSASQPAMPYQLRNDASSAGAFSVEKRTTPIPADPLVTQEPDANMRNGADNRYDPGDPTTWIIDFNKGGVGGNFNSFTTDSGNIPTP